jgi:hypothetical protein
MLGQFITGNARLYSLRACLARIVQDRPGEVMLGHVRLDCVWPYYIDLCKFRSY